MSKLHELLLVQIIQKFPKNLWMIQNSNIIFHSNAATDQHDEVLSKTVFFKTILKQNYMQSLHGFALSSADIRLKSQPQANNRFAAIFLTAAT